MKIFVCLDDNNGLSFNNRRQSMDKTIRKKMLALTEGAPLFMNAYSFCQFENAPAQIVVDEHFLEKMGAQDFGFVESCAFSLDAVSVLYVFRWNRLYPKDTVLDFRPTEMNFTLISKEDFAGNSHEKITLEIYRRNEV